MICLVRVFWLGFVLMVIIWFFLVLVNVMLRSVVMVVLFMLFLCDSMGMNCVLLVSGVVICVDSVLCLCVCCLLLMLMCCLEIVYRK